MSESPVNFRSEALGAFAHEFRTPLTAIKMVMELGRRGAPEGAINLDPDIAGMLVESVANLEVLADGIQSLSWLERGKLSLEDGPCDLGTIIEAARASLDEAVTLSVSGVDGITGPWDSARLPKVLAAVVETVSRCGGGPVALHATTASGGTRLCISSGEPGGNERPINADLGFEFFAACVTLEYGDATVSCERASRYLMVDIELPG